MTFTPRARSTDQRFYGIAPALIVANDDSEGRVKVSFPWFNRDMVSEWCRVAQLYAGDGYGSLFVPEVGDEVLVAFIHGDMRHPVILGGLYNGTDRPPIAKSSSRDPKYLRTKRGHLVLLDDTAGQGRIEIVDASGNRITIDSETNSISISAKGELTLNGAGVVIDSSEEVTIKGKRIRLN
ncbi:MAG: phage baseplate assembly protein V [Rhodospirillales bacterium]